MSKLGNRIAMQRAYAPKPYVRHERHVVVGRSGHWENVTLCGKKTRGLSTATEFEVRNREQPQYKRELERLGPYCPRCMGKVDAKTMARALGLLKREKFEPVPLPSNSPHVQDPGKKTTLCGIDSSTLFDRPHRTVHGVPECTTCAMNLDLGLESGIFVLIDDELCDAAKVEAVRP
jgi:hypothetical protein